jgi:beta-phosphoglucomutase-like phosphatase (HAD superfamily)
MWVARANGLCCNTLAFTMRQAWTSLGERFAYDMSDDYRKENIAVMKARGYRVVRVLVTEQP